MKVTIVGKRGQAFVAGLRSVPGVRVAGFCELDPAALEQVADRHGIPERYRAYEDVLASDADAVVVATPMPLHAPQSIAALAAGKHVLCEVTAAVGLDECRALVEAVERSRRVYMLAENYCFRRESMLVLELVRRGLFGRVYYGEGAYLHDCRHVQYDRDGQPTWRTVWQVGRRGCTYGTHSLGPVLLWLDDRLTTVACQGSGVHTEPRHRLDDVVVMLGQTARGGLVDVRLDMQSRRPHNMTHYVLQGTRGAYLSGRHPGEPGLVWLADRSPGPQEWEPIERYADEFMPAEWRRLGAAAAEAGHGGGDFMVARLWAEAVRSGQPPPIDVHRALDFTVPGLVSEQSIAAGGAPVPVPDFR